ncbi:hypothetical protein TNCT_729291 [Trichonephila clavata]|uniref:Uncharacterized protein n=1 Tax=Trichonephila clavata TaxID=2740835 RepID=A0A8X6LG99_TRICU|nr:hypothetical protein TNCT_729291 [Trichonephila clavata]
MTPFRNLQARLLLLFCLPRLIAQKSKRSFGDIPEVEVASFCTKSGFFWRERRDLSYFNELSPSFQLSRKGEVWIARFRENTVLEEGNTLFNVITQKSESCSLQDLRKSILFTCTK